MFSVFENMILSPLKQALTALSFILARTLLSRSTRLVLSSAEAPRLGCNRIAHMTISSDQIDHTWPHHVHLALVHTPNRSATNNMANVLSLSREACFKKYCFPAQNTGKSVVSIYADLPFDNWGSVTTTKLPESLTMSDLEAVSELIASIGPLVDDIMMIEQLEEDRWLLVFDEESALEIECDPVANKLVFTSILCPVVEENRTEIYQALLNFNFLWRETGGVRMALDGDQQNVAMLFDLFHPDLDSASLAAVVANLRDAALNWREALQSDAASETISDLPPTMGTGIRV